MRSLPSSFTGRWDIIAPPGRPPGARFSPLPSPCSTASATSSISPSFPDALPNIGETILDVCRRNSVDVPTLCHLKGATPTGACRICVVEVEGARSLLAVLLDAGGQNMVSAPSPRLWWKRAKSSSKLMLSSGNHNCAVRGSDGQDWTGFQLKVQADDGSDNFARSGATAACRIWPTATRSRRTVSRPPKSAIPWKREPVHRAGFSRCIQCGRCVQACNEVQVNNAISFGYRGAETKIIAAGDRPLKDSDCVFCGECVQACPVGALVEKDVRYTVRPWETTGAHHLQLLRRRAASSSACQRQPGGQSHRGGRRRAPNYGSLCVKGRFGYHFIGSPERLTTPLIKKRRIPGSHLGRSPGPGGRTFMDRKNETTARQPSAC
jgi:predicted molibdopterin-dependent oxidoreductase YjgC